MTVIDGRQAANKPIQAEQAKRLRLSVGHIQLVVECALVVQLTNCRLPGWQPQSSERNSLSLFSIYLSIYLPGWLAD